MEPPKLEVARRNLVLERHNLALEGRGLVHPALEHRSFEHLALERRIARLGPQRRVLVHLALARLALAGQENRKTQMGPELMEQSAGQAGFWSCTTKFRNRQCTQRRLPKDRKT